MSEAEMRQVLEFGDETYCVDVDELTVVPNLPPHVEGVVKRDGEFVIWVQPSMVRRLLGVESCNLASDLMSPNQLYSEILCVDKRCIRQWCPPNRPLCR